MELDAWEVTMRKRSQESTIHAVSTGLTGETAVWSAAVGLEPSFVASRGVFSTSVIVIVLFSKRQASHARGVTESVFSATDTL